MAAYFIVYREGPLQNQAEYAEYQRKARQGGGGDFKLTPLVLGGRVHAVEGAPPESVIVLQFPTVDDARAWYNSPGYQAALPHRIRSGNFRAVIVEGL
jgi:uncharacterized protein (DUF1330 family)